MKREEELLRAVGRAEARGALVLAAPGPAAGVVRSDRQVPAGSLIPVAEGARLADPSRPVVAVGTCPDLYGEGLGSLLHAAARNVGVVCLVTEHGGPEEPAMNHVGLALAAGATFVAEDACGEEATAMMDAALAHSGFALVEVGCAGHKGAGMICRGPERSALEYLLLHQAPLVTALGTIAEEDWERLLYDDGEDDGDEPDPDGAWS